MSASLAGNSAERVLPSAKAPSPVSAGERPMSSSATAPLGAMAQARERAAAGRGEEGSGRQRQQQQQEGGPSQRLPPRGEWVEGGKADGEEGEGEAEADGERRKGKQAAAGVIPSDEVRCLSYRSLGRMDESNPLLD